MKKTLVVLSIVASMVATMACGGAGKFKSDIDSLSYAIGADLGLNIRFSVEDLDLDQAMVADNLKDFLKNGDIESEEFMQGNFGFASTLLDTLRKHNNRCPVMLSSSIQATLVGRYAEGDYGKSKKAGEELFFTQEAREFYDDRGAEFYLRPKKLELMP